MSFKHQWRVFIRTIYRKYFKTSATVHDKAEPLSYIWLREQFVSSCRAADLSLEVGNRTNIFNGFERTALTCLDDQTLKDVQQLLSMRDLVTTRIVLIDQQVFQNPTSTETRAIMAAGIDDELENYFRDSLK